MDGKDISSDQVIAEMLEMGFEYANIMEAIKAVGPSINSAVEFILNSAGRNSLGASTSTKNSKSYMGNGKGLRKRELASSHSLSNVRQSSMLDRFQSNNKSTESKVDIVGGVTFHRVEVLPGIVEEHKEPSSVMDTDTDKQSGACIIDSVEELDSASDLEQKASNLLQKHFGFSTLKSFQKEALTAWATHNDCLVLAATGSGIILRLYLRQLHSYCASTHNYILAGKSLCFQIPALLSGKVVVVISPLISLMHDQCLKLARHGISACFLGSGQPDNTVEQKAMRGMYSIIYICPETVLR